jgi:hypothetical protein
MSLGSEIREPEKTYSGSRNPDQGVKEAQDTGSRIRIRNTAIQHINYHIVYFRIQVLSSDSGLIEPILNTVSLHQVNNIPLPPSLSSFSLIKG